MDTRLRRAIGFPPSETTRLVNEMVVANHAEEAAFLWTLRDRATRAPHYTLRDLFKLDERVEAHLDGLRTAMSTAWQLCRENLAKGDGPGELFALAAVAFSAGHRDLMFEAVRAGSGADQMQRGLVSALAWIEFDDVSPWLANLLEAGLPGYRAIGLAAFARHRRDPGRALTEALADEDAPLRGQALRAVGELGREDLADAAVANLRHADDGCRFWAAWSAALLGLREGSEALARFVEHSDARGRRALTLFPRILTFERARDWIRSLLAEPGSPRLAIAAVGMLGDPLSVPWLIKHMDSPDARLAGEAFTMITGSDLERSNLDDTGSAVQRDFEEEGALSDEDDNLPTPSKVRVEAWWEQHEGEFTAGVRYLAGKPIEPAWLHEVLVSGRQRQRAAAALELARLKPGSQLFNVCAPGRRQCTFLDVPFEASSHTPGPLDGRGGRHRS